MKWSVAFKALLPVLVITFSAVLSLGSTQIDDASSVVWCEQSEHPIYNLNDGVHCEKPAETVEFVHPSGMCIVLQSFIIMENVPPVSAVAIQG